MLVLCKLILYGIVLFIVIIVSLLVGFGIWVCIVCVS